MKLSRIKKLIFLHLQHLPMKSRGWRPTLCKWGGGGGGKKKMPKKDLHRRGRYFRHKLS